MLYRDTRFMSPKKWGLVFWNYMFQLTKCNLSLKKLKIHLRDILWFIPCKACRIHTRKYFKKNFYTLKTTNLFEWLFDFKSAVNYRIGKPTINKNQARREQEILCAEDVRYVRYMMIDQIIKTVPSPKSEFSHNLGFAEEEVTKRVNRFICTFKSC